MKKISAILFLICIAGLISSGCNNSTINSTVTIWETDSFYVEVDHAKFLTYVDKKKTSNQKGDRFLASHIEKEERNIFKIAEACSEKFTLQYWTVHFYKKEWTVFRNKASNMVETEIELRPYSDVGTSGKDVYIRDNYIFRIIEFVY